MSHAYALRPATDDDYDFLYALHVSTIRPAVEATWGWDEAFQIRHFRDKFVPEKNQVVLVNGQEVGVLKLEERDGDLFIALIEIAPVFQSAGLGSRIIQDVMAAAFARRQAVSLHVLKANPDARRLYERLGFQLVETLEERHVLRIAPPDEREA